MTTIMPCASRTVLAADLQRTPAGARLLIVAPESFREPLAEYIQFKKRFRPVDFTTLEQAIKSSQGVDDPERLKRFVYREWKERGLGYVLLVGDRDIMPVRYMVLDRVTPAAFDYAFYPSDLYYGDVARDDGSFDDWNGQRKGFHAGYFGEVRGEKNKADPINYDKIHYRCQVAVGRWPVNTAAQLKNVVAKSIAYEKGIREGTHPRMRDVCLFNVAGWVDARDLLHRIAGGLPRGYRAEEYYFQDQNPNFKTAQPDTEHILEALDRGAGLCLHVGHGSETTWEGSALSRKNVKQIKNADRLPVVISAGCSTAYFAPLGPYEAYTDIQGAEHRGTDAGEVFTSPPPPPAPYQKRSIKESLGKSLLIDGPNGAVAYIGCNTGGQPCALTLLDGLMAGLRTEREPVLGDCWRYAIGYYYERERLASLVPRDGQWYPPSIFFQGMKYMVFGDPTLPLAPPTQP
jgi:hypothetical protein